VTSTVGSILDNPYLEFEELWPEGRKTAIVGVYSKSHGMRLGQIMWWGRWRQYCFFPDGHTIFNVGCMETIMARIDELMERRKS